MEMTKQEKELQRLKKQNKELKARLKENNEIYQNEIEELENKLEKSKLKITNLKKFKDDLRNVIDELNDEIYRLNEVGEPTLNIYNTTFDECKNDNNIDCCICYEPVKLNQYIYTCNKCNNSVHNHCYLYIDDSKKICPYCRNNEY